MHRLFGLSKQRAPALAGDPPWSDRLAAVGRVLDASGLDLREIAVATTGAEIRVSALAWRSGRFHAGWTTLTATVADGALVVLGSDRLPPPSAGSTGGKTWADRLRAVGHLLDHEPRRLRDACVLEAEGGFVVEALVEDPGAGDWALTSREFPAEVVAASGDAARAKGRRGPG